MRRLTELAETTPLNRVEMGDTRLGFITAGICYQYVREVFPEASVCKLGMVWPLPVRLLRDFASKVDRLIVVRGTGSLYRRALPSKRHPRGRGQGFDGPSGRAEPVQTGRRAGQARPPFPLARGSDPAPPAGALPGCPHRGTFYILQKLKLNVFGDIGCYTLGALPPFGDGFHPLHGRVRLALHGFNTVRGPESAASTVAVIGDSTFMHSGITSLVDIVYNKGISTVLILDNSITGMTGHQQNPTTGLTLKGEPTTAVDLQKLCEGLGIRRIRVADPGDLAGLEAAIREELVTGEPSVIIVRRPCALLPQVKANQQPPLRVESEKCRSCRMCMKIGCPAISFEQKADIDPTQCVGCELCVQMCKFGAIGKEAH